MFEVGIVGAPGSGKTDLIREIIREIPMLPGGHGVQAIMPDVPLGLAADYSHNLMIAADRMQKARTFRAKGMDYILNGTLVECLAYCSMALDLIANDPPTPENQVKQLRTFHTAAVVTFMAVDELPQQTLFYLPLHESDDPTGYPLTVDQAIREALDIFELPVRTIEGDDRAAQIIEALKETTVDA